MTSPTLSGGRRASLSPQFQHTLRSVRSNAGDDSVGMLTRLAEIDAEMSARLDSLKGTAAVDALDSSASKLPPLAGSPTAQPLPSTWGALSEFLFYTFIAVLHLGVSLGVCIVMSDANTLDDVYADGYAQYEEDYL